MDNTLLLEIIIINKEEKTTITTVNRHSLKLNTKHFLKKKIELFSKIRRKNSTVFQ